MIRPLGQIAIVDIEPTNVGVEMPRIAIERDIPSGCPDI
jgi:hypothetical protein